MLINYKFSYPLYVQRMQARHYSNRQGAAKIHAVLPLNFFMSETCLRRLHTWLRNSSATEKLSDLTIIAMHTIIPVPRDEICGRFISLAFDGFFRY